MSKLEYWMNPGECEEFTENPTLTLQVLIHCINYIKAIEAARKHLETELQELGFPGFDALNRKLI